MKISFRKYLFVLKLFLMKFIFPLNIFTWIVLIPSIDKHLKELWIQSRPKETSDLLTCGLFYDIKTTT